MAPGQVEEVVERLLGCWLSGRLEAVVEVLEELGAVDLGELHLVRFIKDRFVALVEHHLQRLPNAPGRGHRR